MFNYESIPCEKKEIFDDVFALDCSNYEKNYVNWKIYVDNSKFPDGKSLPPREVGFMSNGYVEKNEYFFMFSHNCPSLSPNELICLCNLCNQILITYGIYFIPSEVINNKDCEMKLSYKCHDVSAHFVSENFLSEWNFTRKYMYHWEKNVFPDTETEDILGSLRFMEPDCSYVYVKIPTRTTIPLQSMKALGKIIEKISGENK